MKTILMSSFFLFPCILIQAQDSIYLKKNTAAFIFTGSVDGYYQYNLHNPKTAPYNNITSFTQSNNSFELGMASVRMDHSFGKVSVTADIGFGRRVEEFAYNDTNTLQPIKQLYITYTPLSAIKFTLGSWATHVGYELVDPYLNRNYSMSFMFTKGPFTHTGIKADISLGGKTAIMLGLSNPIDYRTAPASPKTLIAQISTGSKNDKFKVYFNFVYGKQTLMKKITQADIVATYTVNNKFSVGLNATQQTIKTDVDTSGKFLTGKWQGIALYLNYDPVKWLGLTLRNEYINDKDGLLGLRNVYTPTLSANIKIDNLTIIPEFRYQKVGNPIFYKNLTAQISTTASFILAAVYHF